MYEAAVRKAGGPWEHRVRGMTMREARRNLAKVAGLPVRVADNLPVGRRTKLTVGKWAEAEVRG